MEGAPTTEDDSAAREEVASGKRTGLLALAGIVGSTYFALSVAALHFLRPEHDPTTQTISEYAVGPYGYLMIIAFFALGAASLSLSLGIGAVRSPSRSSQVGVYLVAIWGAGILVAGIFPTDVTGSPSTPSGAIHDAASIVAFVAVVTGAILFSRGMRRDAGWPHRSLSSGLAYAVLVGFLAFILSQEGAPGIGQRVFLAFVLAWLVLTGVQLRRMVASSPG